MFGWILFIIKRHNDIIIYNKFINNNNNTDKQGIKIEIKKDPIKESNLTKPYEYNFDRKLKKPIDIFINKLEPASIPKNA